jgi:phenylalanyl-tRNA synthetase alpha chain
MNLKKINKIKQKSLEELDNIKNLNSLKEFKIKYLGRKSELTQILRSIKDLPKEKKAEFGKAANLTRISIEKKFDNVKEKIEFEEVIKESEELDVTAPGIPHKIGHIHPITQIRWETEEIFQKMGFEIIEPYELDDDYHNFESLNMPKDHPARDIWDTFWTEDGYILSTHTSSMQNRIFRSIKPPIRAIVIGKTFRNERTDPRHEHTLYQCEGVYIDKGISLSHMIGTLKTFFDVFFDKDISIKVSPGYFPFVEPGCGMDLSCFICNMKGCRVCKYTGWLEIMGCGMIHPNVLKEGSIDPDVYSGFAWGFGLDRLVMLKYGIEDIRHFHSGDLRFIKQF